MTSREWNGQHVRNMAGDNNGNLSNFLEIKDDVSIERARDNSESVRGEGSTYNIHILDDSVRPFGKREIRFSDQ